MAFPYYVVIAPSRFGSHKEIPMKNPTTLALNQQTVRNLSSKEVKAFQPTTTVLTRFVTCTCLK
jgi:hypothetical protein